MLNSTLKALSATKEQNGEARLTAINGTVELSNLIPPTVSYESRGNVLLVGEEDVITALEAQFTSLNSVTLLATAKAESKDKANNSVKRNNLYFASKATVKGYLGAFEVSCDVESMLTTVNLAKVAIGRDCFDLIVDMTDTGLTEVEISAPAITPLGQAKRNWPMSSKICLR